MNIINLTFIFFLFFINQIYIVFHKNIITYINQNDYLLDNNKQFVQINYSYFDNLFLFLNLVSILIFILFRIIIKRKFKIINFDKSFNILLLLFISIFFLQIIYSLNIKLLIFDLLILLILFFLFYFNKFLSKSFDTSKLYKILFYLTIFLIFLKPLFYNFNISENIFWHNIHNYSLSLIYNFSDYHKIPSNYYNNLINIFFKFLSNLSFFKYLISNVSIIQILSVIGLFIVILYNKLLLRLSFSKNNLINPLIFYFSSIFALIIIDINLPGVSFINRYFYLLIFIYILTNNYNEKSKLFSLIVLSSFSIYINPETFIACNLTSIFYIYFVNTNYKTLFKSLFIYSNLALFTIFISYYFINLFYEFNFDAYINVLNAVSFGWSKIPINNPNTNVLLIYFIFSISIYFLVDSIYKKITLKKISNITIYNFIFSFLIIFFCFVYYRRPIYTAQSSLIIIIFVLLFFNNLNYYLDNLNLKNGSISFKFFSIILIFCLIVFNYLYIFNLKNNKLYHSFQNTGNSINYIKGYSLPDPDFKLLKIKSNYLKGKEEIYFSDFSFFINLNNEEISRFDFIEPFNDIITIDSFDNMIKKLSLLKKGTIINIDCVKHRANLNSKNYYIGLMEALLKNNYKFVDKCNEFGFTKLIKDL